MRGALIMWVGLGGALGCGPEGAAPDLLGEATCEFSVAVQSEEEFLLQGDVVHVFERGGPRLRTRRSLPLHGEGWATRLTFDDEGRLLSRSEDYGDDGIVDTRQSWSYDERGRQVGSVQDQNADGRPDQRWGWRWGANGRVSEYSILSGEGFGAWTDLVGEASWREDEGQPVEEILWTRGQATEPEQVALRSFDDEGRLSEQTALWWASGELNRHTAWSYASLDDELSSYVQEDELDSVGRTQRATRRWYDARGHLVKQEVLTGPNARACTVWLRDPLGDVLTVYGSPEPCADDAVTITRDAAGWTSSATVRVGSSEVTARFQITDGCAGRCLPRAAADPFAEFFPWPAKPVDPVCE
jgi:hypothetical protein